MSRLAGSAEGVRIHPLKGTLDCTIPPAARVAVETQCRIPSLQHCLSYPGRVQPLSGGTRVNAKVPADATLPVAEWTPQEMHQLTRRFVVRQSERMPQFVTSSSYQGLFHCTRRNLIWRSLTKEDGGAASFQRPPVWLQCWRGVAVFDVPLSKIDDDGVTRLWTHARINKYISCMAYALRQTYMCVHNT
jgi:hypothetical protein